MSTNDELNWFKSSYSGSEGDSCVEVARRPDAVHVRDSKEKDGSRLTVSQAAWVAFIEFAGV
ncbi:DUF397 domain-containing protein [Streptomyces sp. NPDC029004]|uniref:DUF397 domain-containing protein n=1 Tax=Streptomyces sp. NPDC029004 TaxID=3154490 RepID=UPI0033ED3331